MKLVGVKYRADKNKSKCAEDKREKSSTFRNKLEITLIFQKVMRKLLSYN